MLSFGLPHAVPSIGDKHHRHLVFPIAVHQVPEALLGSRDRRPAPHQHPINVKEEPERAGVLTRKLRVVAACAVYKRGSFSLTC